MKIQLSKFGTLLASRQAGKEAYAAFLPVLREAKDDSSLYVDFGGVLTLAPSWADEFLIPLLKEYGQRLVLEKTENSSVVATLQFLEKIHTVQFVRK